MKKLIMFLAIMLLTFSLAFGVYVEIGTGTGYEPTQWPFYNYYENNKTQTLYLSSEIGDATTFESIGFNIERVASSSHTELVDFTVNFLHTNVNALTDGAYHDMTGATQVFYSASYTLASATGWNEIDITDFAYNGTQNLIVEIIWGDNGSFTSICYRNLKTDDGAGVVRTLYGYADHTTPPNYNGSSTSYSNIRFNYTLAGFPGAPSNPSPDDTAISVAIAGDLTWDFGADTETYDLWFGPAGAMTEVVTGSDAGASGSYSYSGLDFAALYEWQVIAHNSSEATTNGPVWSFTSENNPNYVQIGDGVETGMALPIEPYYGYSYSNIIILASEIAESAIITGLQYQYQSTDGFGDPDDIVIYMGHTTQSEFIDGDDWIDVTTMTEVFNSQLAFPPAAGDWIQIDLSTPFTYNGTDNMVIAWDENTDGYHSNSDDFFCTNTSVNRSLVYRSDSTNPDPLSPPTATYHSVFIANVRLNIVGSLPPSLPTNPNPEDSAVDVAIEGDLTWDFGADTETYDLWFGPAGAMAEVITGSAAGASGSYPYSDLDHDTLYEWQVIAHNSTDETTNGPVWSFTTIETFVAEPPTNLLVDELGYATWEAPNGRRTYRSPILGTRDFIGYNVYLEGAFVESTIDLFWQYVDLNNGQTYIGGVTAVYDEGESDIIEVSFTYTGTDAGNVIVAATKLNGNYPNPFNPVTNIAYSIKEAGNVTIEVYNIKGQLVKILVNEARETGNYTITWKGRDNSNKSVVSGVYFYKMKAQNYNSTKKMILMK